MLNKLQEWNAYVVAQRVKGSNVNTRSIVLYYVTRYQRVKAAEVVNYFYKTYGSNWESPEMSAELKRQLNNLCTEGSITFSGDFYCVKEN